MERRTELLERMYKLGKMYMYIGKIKVSSSHVKLKDESARER